MAKKKYYKVLHLTSGTYIMREYVITVESGNFSLPFYGVDSETSSDSGIDLDIELKLQGSPEDLIIEKVALFGSKRAAEVAIRDIIDEIWWNSDESRKKLSPKEFEIVEVIINENV